MLKNGLKPSQIQDATNIGLNKIYHVWRNWQDYGHVSRPTLAPGHPRKLDSAQLDVSSQSIVFSHLLMSSEYIESLVVQQPDIYIDEIKDNLSCVLGVFVSYDMIMCGLKQHGFT
jgi:hypothetical protein